MICASARSGSTLLCRLLDQSGVAGHPESWFRRQDRDDYAEDWSLPRDAAGQVQFTDYLAAARTAATGPNGIAAFRIMRDTFGELDADLRALCPETESTHALLQRSFGRMKFVHLSREDKVAQAVSRLRAEQSGLWHRIGDWEERFDKSDPTPRYNRAAIAGYVIEAENDAAAWTGWFAQNGIVPLRIIYEDLAEAPVVTAQRLLSALGLPTDAPLVVRNTRLADAMNADWIARYRAGS